MVPSSSLSIMLKQTCWHTPGAAWLVTGVTSEKQTSAKPVPAWGCLPSWWLLATLLARSMESVPTWWAEWPAGGASAQGWPHLPAGPSSPTQHPGVLGDDHREDCSQAVAAPATKPPYSTDPSPSGAPALPPQTSVPRALADLQGGQCHLPPPPLLTPYVWGSCQGSGQEHYFLFPFRRQSLTGIYCAPAVCKRFVL